MNTKLKGDIGELIVAHNLLKKGWSVSMPYGENNRYDLIIEKDGLMKRVQVKACTPKDGVLHVNCRSSNNWSVIKYTEKDFEILAAVDLNTEIVYYISSKNINKSVFDLRLVQTKNNQKKKVNYAENFLEIKN